MKIGKLFSSGACAAVLLAAVSSRSFSATLNVKIADLLNNPLSDVTLMAVAFVEGSDEPNSVYSKTDKTVASGTVAVTGLLDKDPYGKAITYKIGLIKHMYLPTIKEQINNPGIPKVTFASAGDVNSQFFATPLRMSPPPSDFRAGMLNVKIATTSISGDTMMMMDLRHRLTDEPVAFGMQLARLPSNIAETHFYLQIYNIPPAPANTYKLRIAKAGTLEGAEVVISTAIEHSAVPTFPSPNQEVQFGFVSQTRSDVQTTIEYSKTAFEGIVTGVVAGSTVPLANCNIEIRDTDGSVEPTSGRRWSDFNFFRTLTDASGRFVVLKPEYGDIRFSSYSVLVSKMGFKSLVDRGADPDGAGPLMPQGYIYRGDRVMMPQYILAQTTGVIKGVVSVNGVPIPDAQVELKNEFDWFVGMYPKIFDQGGWFNTSTRGDGSFEFAGVAPGQYNLIVRHSMLKGNTDYWKGWEWGNNTPNSQESWNFNYNYNYGADQRSSMSAVANYDPDGVGPMLPVPTRLADDRRIVITSDTIKSAVYSTSGAPLVAEGATINVDMVVSISTNAKITGNFYFPTTVTIPAEEAIKIIAHPIDPATYRFLEWEGGGIAFYADPSGLSGTGSSKSFEIKAATGSYYVEIKSDKWVPVRRYNTMVKLSAGDSIILPDIYMVRAGRLEGKIKLPDGSYFQAKENPDGTKITAMIEVRGADVDYQRREEVSSWGNDPTRFVFDALPPGRYFMTIEIKKFSSTGGAESLYPQADIGNIRVVAAQTTFIEAAVDNGVLCEPLAPVPPDRPEVDYTVRSSSGAGFYIIVGFPSDFAPKGADMQALIENQGRLEGFYLPMFEFNPFTKAWPSKKILAGNYNFYLVFVRLYGPADNPVNLTQGAPQNNRDANMVIISRAENVNIKADDLATGATYQIKMGAGVMGPGIVTGGVKGKSIFRAVNASAIKGNFSEMVKVIPTAMLYDMDGKLRAFSATRPENKPRPGQLVPDMLKWDLALMLGDADRLNIMLNDETSLLYAPVDYYMDNVPQGRYVLVLETKNYPPVTKIVTISTSAAIVNIDFDKDAQAGAAISGVVTDTSGNPIREANVLLTHRIAVKKAVTDADGKFAAPGLSAGSWKIDVMKSGYAVAGERISLGKEDKSVTIRLKAALARIEGKIYTRESGWGMKNTYAGAKVVAYNETENVANPTKYLPATTVKTASDGGYLIPDVILGDTYYVYTFVPERPVYYKRVFVSTTAVADINFDVQPSTPTLKLAMKRTENPYVFRFMIESPRPLVEAPECYYSPGVSFDEAGKVRALPTKGVKNSYSLEVEIPSNSDEENYTLQIKGRYGMKEYMTETVTFSQKSTAKSKKEVADELAEGGAILIDDERADNTEVKLEPGALTSEEMTDIPVGGFLSALPNVKMSRTGREISRLIDSAMTSIAASDVYEMSLARAQVNKPFDVALNYDRRKVSDEELADLKVYRYDDASEKWKVVSGVVTADPLTGTVSVETDSLAPTSATRPAQRTVVKNGVFAINKAAAASQTGIFAVFKNDPDTAKNYTGDVFEIINFPNPFDLTAKTVAPDIANANFSQAVVNGTMLKYSLPSDKGGEIKFNIYNLAGELVKTIDEGTKTGGRYYYVEWDGKNDSGQNCASGVYFLIAKKGGEKLTAKPLKMAIVK